MSFNLRCLLYFNAVESSIVVVMNMYTFDICVIVSAYFKVKGNKL